MTTEELKEIAAQLRKPSGLHSDKIANMMNVGNERLYLNSIDVFSPNKSDKILEIGMGNGKFTRNILDSGTNLKYTGCDYSEEMVKAANTLNSDLIEYESVTFIHSNAIELPFPNESFNWVFTLNTLYFYDNPLASLKEYSRVLTNDGQLLIGIRPKHEMAKYPMTKFGFTLYSLEELKSLLEAANFKVDRIFEKKEPDQVLNGMALNVSSLIAVSSKP